MSGTFAGKSYGPSLCWTKIPLNLAFQVMKNCAEDSEHETDKTKTAPLGEGPNSAGVGQLVTFDIAQVD